ncbi:MAG: hypothetical protein ACFFEF_10390 [Candidatus Thorarchaeota archaeon]
MLSTHLSSLLKTRTIAVILICIIIGVPVIILGQAELSYGGYASTPSATLQVYTLEDIWYPRYFDWQPYPLLITGNMSAYYSRPSLMIPSTILVEIFVEDVTNSSSDLSGFGVYNDEVLQDNGYVNSTVTPWVDGNFGDGENYVSNTTEWTFWPTAGLPRESSSLKRGMYTWWRSITGYQSGERYSICSLEVIFNTDTSLRVYQWSVLIELAILLQESSQLAGHGMRIIIATTMTWIPVFTLGLSGPYIESMNITRGDGTTDNGVKDYWFYMLEGNVEIHYDWGG